MLSDIDEAQMATAKGGEYLKIHSADDDETQDLNHSHDEFDADDLDDDPFLSGEWALPEEPRPRTNTVTMQMNEKRNDIHTELKKAMLFRDGCRKMLKELGKRK